MNWNNAHSANPPLVVHHLYAVVIAVTIVLMQKDPPVWVSFLPLPPAPPADFAGLYLFVLPYLARWRQRKV